MGFNDSRGPDSVTAIEVDQPVWTEEDEKRANVKLRARGVMFESDSEAEEDMSDDSTYQPPRRRADPLWQPRISSNLFDIDPLLELTDQDSYFAAFGASPPGKKNRPTKKQLVGNLLNYQCRDNKKKFGNPHQEVDRAVENVEVTAVVQREARLETPDPFAVGRLEKKTVTMTLKGFIGVPDEPVIVQGRSKDELAFKEGKNDRSRNTVGTPRARARRVTDDEKFPFVYNK